jgi:hypothetical protein
MPARHRSAHFITHWRHSSPRVCGGRPVRAKQADALAFVSLLKHSGSTVRACLSMLCVVAEVDVTQLEIDSMRLISGFMLPPSLCREGGP